MNSIIKFSPGILILVNYIFCEIYYISNLLFHYKYSNGILCLLTFLHLFLYKVVWIQLLNFHSIRNFHYKFYSYSYKLYFLWILYRICYFITNIHEWYYFFFIFTNISPFIFIQNSLNSIIKFSPGIFIFINYISCEIYMEFVISLQIFEWYYFFFIFTNISPFYLCIR